MGKRTSIKIDEATHEMLQKRKRESENWDEFLWRLTGTYEIETRSKTKIERFAETIDSFLKDETYLQIDGVVSVDELYNTYRGWAAKNDKPHDPGKAKFGKALRHVEFADIESTQRRIDGRITNVYTGIELR